MKGFAYSLEALLGIGIILVAVVTLFGTSSSQSTSKTLKDIGDGALKSLDESGILREYALIQDSNQLLSQLSNSIPVTLNYNVSFCRYATCTSVVTPKTQNVYTSFYYYSGAPGNYSPTEVVLYIWEK